VLPSGDTQDALQKPNPHCLLLSHFAQPYGTAFAVQCDEEGRNAPGMKPRILIVDDDSTITQQLYWTLSGEYDVVTANDMQTAIRRATFYKPDISILDLQMPPDKDSPTSGLRLLEYIKGHLSNSRVLIMSSNSTSEVRSKCFAAGADGFFAKPFELQDMLTSICKLVPVHRLELFAHIL
jgi:CheY-like chemotaxis protein